MVNLLPTIRLAQSILKRKFPSVDKPLRIIIRPSKKAPQKGSLKNISLEAYFRNFTVFLIMQNLLKNGILEKVELQCEGYLEIN